MAALEAALAFEQAKREGVSKAEVQAALAALVQAPDCPALMPSEGVLALHDWGTEQEFHGDPVRPEAGSLVYRIPAWDVLGQLQAAGFSEARMHHIASWKHGVLGSDLPGVLVIEA